MGWSQWLSLSLVDNVVYHRQPMKVPYTKSFPYCAFMNSKLLMKIKIKPRFPFSLSLFFSTIEATASTWFRFQYWVTHPSNWIFLHCCFFGNILVDHFFSTFDLDVKRGWTADRWLTFWQCRIRENGAGGHLHASLAETATTSRFSPRIGFIVHCFLASVGSSARRISSQCDFDCAASGAISSADLRVRAFLFTDALGFISASIKCQRNNDHLVGFFWYCCFFNLNLASGQWIERKTSLSNRLVE